jgi:hypothetical protein
MLHGVDADPGTINMRRGLDNPVPNHRRQCQADRAGHVDLVQDLADNVCDCLRRGRRRGMQPYSLADKLSCGDIDGRTLNPRSPDIDANGNVRSHFGGPRLVSYSPGPLPPISWATRRPRP